MGVGKARFQAELQATPLPENGIQASDSGSIPCLNSKENQAATSQIRQVIQAEARQKNLIRSSGESGANPTEAIRQMSRSATNENRTTAKSKGKLMQNQDQENSSDIRPQSASQWCAYLLALAIVGIIEFVDAVPYHVRYYLWCAWYYTGGQIRLLFMSWRL